MSKRPPMLYIAGPMSGWPGMNFEAFHRAEAHLVSLGYIVINPAKLPAGHTQEWYRTEGVKAVCSADGVATLPEWQGSVGACLEVKVAKVTGRVVRPLYAWERAYE